MQYDFSGYATKNDLECADGRVIRKDAFKECDGTTVPLVWHHMHNDPTNVLGHADLENRSDGVYAYCSFNDTPQGNNAKQLVQHGDVTYMSIYANKLKQHGNNVIHGLIREVSLVLAGANPGALIDPLSIQHEDGSLSPLDEAYVYTGIPLDLPGESSIEHADDDQNEKDDDMAGKEKTVQDVLDSMTEEQRNITNYLVGLALNDNAEEDDDEAEHSDFEEDDMHKNIFETDEDVSTWEKVYGYGKTSGSITYMLVPKKYIKDGVDFLKNKNVTGPDLAAKRLYPEVDASCTHINAISGYSGEVLYRRTVSKTPDGRKILMDTNNSSNDFKVSTTIKPREYDEE